MAWIVCMLLFSFLTVMIKVVVGVMYLQGEMDVSYSFEEFISNLKISAFYSALSVIASYIYKRFARYI